MKVPKEIQDLIEQLPNTSTELVQVFQDRKSLNCQIIEGTVNLLTFQDMAVIKVSIRKYLEDSRGKTPPKSWRIPEIKRWAYANFPKMIDTQEENWQLAAFAVVGEYMNKGLDSPAMKLLMEKLTNALKINSHYDVKK